MKHLVYILLGLMLVGVFSCRRSPGGTEARLVAIDSLITAEPDSALALLAGINADSLPADLRAYHDVLTTQALYKAYIPATTDTLIARAWSYYRNHGPYDRRIRTMLYSGTTAEELGHPDSAMRWYKRTELESRPDDHYHRAYAQEYMGILYQKCIDFPEAINKYRSAIDYFQRYDTASYLFCCQQLSQLYQNDNIDVDSSEYFIANVQKIAKARNDSVYIILAITSKASSLFYDSCYASTIETILSVIDKSDLPKKCWYYMAQSYAKLGQADSAEKYLILSQQPITPTDSSLFYHTKSLICSLRGNWQSAHKFEVMSDKIAEKEYLSLNTSSLQLSEREIEQEVSANLYHEQFFYRNIIIALILLVMTAGFIFLIKKHIKKRHNERLLLEQIKWLEKNHEMEINKLRSSQRDSDFVKMLYAQLSLTFEQNIQPLGDIASDYFQNGNNAASFMKHFQKQFKLLWSSKEMWQQIENYINRTYNNCFSHLLDISPNLTTEERHLAMLSILGFNSMAVAICMGYKSQNVVYAMKSKLKKKLGLDCSIEEYLKSWEMKA